MKGTNRAVLGSSDQRNVPARLSLFQKMKKSQDFLYLGKGPESGPSTIFDLSFEPNDLGHRSQITEGHISYTESAGQSDKKIHSLNLVTFHYLVVFRDVLELFIK
jgi:hypothetical protein